MGLLWSEEGMLTYGQTACSVGTSTPEIAQPARVILERSEWRNYFPGLTSAIRFAVQGLSVAPSHQSLAECHESLAACSGRSLGPRINQSGSPDPLSETCSSCLCASEIEPQPWRHTKHTSTMIRCEQKYGEVLAAIYIEIL